MNPDPLSLSPLYVARLVTTPDIADRVDEIALMEADEQCTTWIDTDSNVARIEYFCASPAEASHRLDSLETLVRRHFPNALWTATTEPLPAADWAEAWKRFFHCEKVSDRIWIKPSWESCAPAPGDIVLEIDPGMSFGTGQHGTTRGCLRFLDTLAANHAGLRLLDVGCGSGILAIAAARLGFTDILAVDNDPDAIRVSQENAALNHVPSIAFRVADLASIDGIPPADAVVANILASVLIDHAAILSRLVNMSPHASLILSGILNAQAGEVVSAFQAQGFQLHDSLTLGEWSSLWMKRPAT